MGLPTTFANLAEENELLREQVAMLKRELGLDKDRLAEEAFRREWRLTGREVQMLGLLFQRRGAVLSKEMLLDAMYGGIDEPEIKIVDVFICKLRNKIGSDRIRTAWGRGYALTAQGIKACCRVLGLPEPDIADEPVKEPGLKKEQRSQMTLRAARFLAEEPRTARQVGAHFNAGHGSAIVANLTRKNLVEMVDQIRSPVTGRWVNLYGLTKKGEAYVEARRSLDV